MTARGTTRDLVIGVALVALTLVAFWPLGQNDFVSFDDNIYITQNPNVRAGFTPRGIAWAFTTTYYGAYHPLTWISHMADTEWFGLRPGPHHVHSLLMHCASVLLLFALLKRTTGRPWASAFVAMLFAIHPLQVQSVAWAAERKNILSGFLWLATVCAYVSYAGRPGWRRYITVLFVYVLGLLAKASLVTGPFVLLLMDLWPLGRMSSKSEAASVRRLVLEKVPLLVVAGLASVVTLFSAIVSATPEALPSLGALSLPARTGNALVSCAGYILKMLWPVRLTYFYPYPEAGWPMWQVGAAAAFVVAVTIAAVRRAKANPYLLVGWGWYLLLLLPTLGLVQYGWQAWADRYAYLSLVGIYVIIAWGLSDLFARWRFRRAAFAVASAILACVLVLLTRAQVATWRDDVALFGHAVRVSGDNWVGRLSRLQLGKALYAGGATREAKAEFLLALEGPTAAEAWNNLGSCLALEGSPGEAMECYTRAIELNPKLIRAHYNLGLAFQQRRELDRAEACYAEAIRLGPVESKLTPEQIIKNEPVDDDAHNNLGVIFFLRGDTERALAHYRAAIAFNPNHANARYNLGNALEAGGNRKEAAAEYEAALRLRPDHEQARRGLERLRERE